MRTFTVIMAIILLVLAYYLFTPVLSFGFIGTPFLLLICVGILNIPSFEDEEYISSPLNNTLLTAGIAIACYIIFVPIFTSWGLFHADKYREMVNVNMKTYSSDIAPIDPSKIIIMDETIAAKLADKKLASDDIALGSIVDIGKFTLQKINENPYFVAPLEHAGFFKWLGSKNGTCGYMIVNALNEKDVKLVKEVNGKKIHIRYQPSAYYGEDLMRHIYFSGYKTVGLTDISFELDEERMPWWVVTLYKYKFGFFARVATGVLVVNPETGEIQEYNINNAPKWIDRIQPVEFVADCFNDWGEFVHGWNNPQDVDRVKLSGDLKLIIGSDNNTYYYGGVTSVNSDASSVGFILTNTRDMNITMYKYGGCIESNAMKSAEDKLQDKKYKAIHPTPYSINGELSYVMGMIGESGMIKSVGIVSYSDWNVVGVGDNINDAIRNYRTILKSKGNATVISSDNIKSVIVDEISRIGFDVKNGNNYVYFTLKNHEGKVFITSTDISNKTPLTNVGDIVKITFTSGDEGEVYIDAFDNQNVKINTTKSQQQATEQFEKVEHEKEVKDLDDRVKSKLESMSETEKADFVK